MLPIPDKIRKDHTKKTFLNVIKMKKTLGKYWLNIQEKYNEITVVKNFCDDTTDKTPKERKNYRLFSKDRKIVSY